eukprot:scaffold119714_cov32-Tisochrysis_lutea.AAC.3
MLGDAFRPHYRPSVAAPAGQLLGSGREDAASRATVQGCVRSPQYPCPRCHRAPLPIPARVHLASRECACKPSRPPRARATPAALLAPSLVAGPWLQHSAGGGTDTCTAGPQMDAAHAPPRARSCCSH